MVGLRDEAMRRLRELRPFESGNLSIAAHESAAVYLLPGPLRRYFDRFPQIKVGIYRSRLEEIPRQVMDREIDIGFVKDAPVYHELQSVLVHSDEMVLIASPRHPLVSRGRVAVRDLGSESFVLHHLCSTTEQKILRLFEAHGTRCRIAAELWSFENIKQFVRQDVGVAIVPRVCVAQDLTAGALVEVPVDGLDMPRQTMVPGRARCRRRPAVRRHREPLPVEECAGAGGGFTPAAPGATRSARSRHDARQPKTFFPNITLAGRSASRRMYHGTSTRRS
jgi:DNA-binding transcriptional LysR family regulator